MYIKKNHIENDYIKATCDICGDDCMKEVFAPNDHDGDSEDCEINKTFEGLRLEATWGFASKKDGEKWEAIVCENCADKYFSSIVNFIKKPYI